MSRALPLVIALCIAGCGYRFSGGGAPLPEGTRVVFAPVFTNRTAEPALEATFTQNFREQLVRAGVAGGPEAEARVEGEILSISGAPNIAAPTGLGSYRLSAVVRLRLTRGGRVLAEAEVAGNEDYLPGADPLQSEARRHAAVKRLAEQMMRDGYSRLATGW